MKYLDSMVRLVGDFFSVSILHTKPVMLNGVILAMLGSSRKVIVMAYNAYSTMPSVSRHTQ
jgi:hypothetical protein